MRNFEFSSLVKRPTPLYWSSRVAPERPVCAAHSTGVIIFIEPCGRSIEVEGVPRHVILETMTFESIGGKTRMTNTGVFQSLADRDGMVAEGMESGAIESMERLAELVDEAAAAGARNVGLV